MPKIDPTIPTDHLKINALIPEKELLEILGISRFTLERLRQEGLPAIPLGKGKRAYHEASLMNYLLSIETD